MKISELKKFSIAELEVLIPSLEGEELNLAKDVLAGKKKRAEPDPESEAVKAEDDSKARAEEKEKLKEEAKRKKEEAVKEREQKRAEAMAEKEKAKKEREEARIKIEMEKEEGKVLREQQKEEAIRAREEARIQKTFERSAKAKELATHVEKKEFEDRSKMTKADMVREGMAEGLTNPEIAKKYGLNIKFVCDTQWRIERQIETLLIRAKIRAMYTEKLRVVAETTTGDVQETHEGEDTASNE